MTSAGFYLLDMPLKHTVNMAYIWILSTGELLPLSHSCQFYHILRETHDRSTLWHCQGYIWNTFLWQNFACFRLFSSLCCFHQTWRIKIFKNILTCSRDLYAVVSCGTEESLMGYDTILFNSNFDRSTFSMDVKRWNKTSKKFYKT